MFNTCNLTLERLADADNMKLAQIGGDQAVCVQGLGKLAVSHSARTGMYTVKHGKTLHKCTGTQSLLECVGGKTGYQSIPHLKRTNFPGCDYAVSTTEALKNARIRDFPENATVCVMNNNDILSVTRGVYAKDKAAMTVQHKSGKTGAVKATTHQVCDLTGKLHPQSCKPMRRALSQRIMKNRYPIDKRALFGPELADGTEVAVAGPAPAALGPGNPGAAERYEAQMRATGLTGAGWIGNTGLAWQSQAQLSTYQGIRDGQIAVTSSMIDATDAPPELKDSMTTTLDDINRGRGQTPAEILATQQQVAGDNRPLETIVAESGVPHDPRPYSDAQLDYLRQGLGRTVDQYTTPVSVDAPEAEVDEDIGDIW